ncbi:hypothetical protein V7S43_008815 [Phytophthora oleae]|uniref:Uncharacterized protein n=1 Tax=Phytophthora oleae TaxID=2107226 RepID=A0ABD3FJF0_9STRA
MKGSAQVYLYVTCLGKLKNKPLDPPKAVAASRVVSLSCLCWTDNRLVLLAPAGDRRLLAPARGATPLPLVGFSGLGDVATFLVDHANAVSGVDEEAAKLFDEEPGETDVAYPRVKMQEQTSTLAIKPAECEELQPEDVGRAVLYAVTQLPHVAVNEVLVQSRDRSV